MAVSQIPRLFISVTKDHHVTFHQLHFFRIHYRCFLASSQAGCSQLSQMRDIMQSLNTFLISPTPRLSQQITIAASI